MSNPNTPRHASVRLGHSGRLHRVLLPAALGGVVAGSIWLATTAAAAPAAQRTGDAPASSYQPGSYGSYQPTAPTSYGTGSYGTGSYGSDSPSGWGGSYSGWHDGGGPNAYRNGQSYGGRQDWRGPSGYHGYAPRPHAVVSRSTASTATPHRAASTKTSAQTRRGATPNGARVPSTPAAAQPANEAAGAAVPAHRTAQLSAQQERSINAPAPTAPTPTVRTYAPRQLTTPARGNLAAVDGPREATDYVTLYGAIGGAALAALLSLGGVALGRRRGSAGTPG